jgi:osmoprotectant transport system permease protein
VKTVRTVFIFLSLALGLESHAKTIEVGSKKFTEAVTLGEIIRQSIDSTGTPVAHRQELGGTRILWNALLSGDIDIYVDYTGTISEEILKQAVNGQDDLQAKLRSHGVGVLAPLGFNNTYALGMRQDVADKLQIKKISDLKNHRDLRFGMSSEFKQRADGWPGLQARYKLLHTDLRGLDHDIAYRALQTEDIHITDLYSTDAEISYYNLRILEDDLNYFPNYQAVILYRTELETTHPQVIESLKKLTGAISAEDMTLMNRKVKIDHQTSSAVAADFLNNRFGTHVTMESDSRGERLLQRTGEHLYLVLISLFAAVMAGIPLGFVAYSRRSLGRLILGTVGIIQTIPALALLVVLIKPLSLMGLRGIGNTPALIALFLYSLLPIVRGTFSGLEHIPLHLRETAAVLGLNKSLQLWRIQLPLAMPSILNGIKTAAVLNVGFATLGALVGAGGFGQAILTGIRLDDYSLILEGALPAAGLAVASQLIFDWLDTKLLSPGIR